MARIWRRDLGYADGGVGTFAGAAYDISDPDNPRRLNVTFVEDGRYCADQTWGPNSDQTGCREYLYVMASDYDGDGSTYAGSSPYASDFDLLYAVSGRVPAGRTLYESDPASLTLSFPPLRFLEARVLDNRLVELSAFYTPPEALPAGATIAFTFAPDGGPTQDVGTTYPAGDTPFEALASLDGLDEDTFYTFRARIEDASGKVLYESLPTRKKPLVSRNTSLVGVWDERGSWSDLWGYVAPDGREYALVALQAFGLSVIDISGPTPVEVGFVPTASGANDSKDVKVYDHYAYLVNETGPIQIIDLANPASPVQVGLLDTQPGIVGGGAHNAWIDGETLYAIGGRTERDAGVRIYSLADSHCAPALVGEYRPDHFPLPYYHDFYVDGDRGYGPDIYGDGVDILDLSDKSAPAAARHLRLPRQRRPQRVRDGGRPLRLRRRRDRGGGQLDADLRRAGPAERGLRRRHHRGPAGGGAQLLRDGQPPPHRPLHRGLPRLRYQRPDGARRGGALRHLPGNRLRLQRGLERLPVLPLGPHRRLRPQQRALRRRASTRA